MHIESLVHMRYFVKHIPALSSSDPGRVVPCTWHLQGGAKGKLPKASQNGAPRLMGLGGGLMIFRGGLMILTILLMVG